MVWGKKRWVILRVRGELGESINLVIRVNKYEFLDREVEKIIYKSKMV